MTDPAATRAGVVGAILAAICCTASLVALGLPLAGLGAWLTGAGLVALFLMAAGIGVVAYGLHHRRAKAAACEIKIHKEGKNL